MPNLGSQPKSQPKSQPTNSLLALTLALAIPSCLLLGGLASAPAFAQSEPQGEKPAASDRASQKAAEKAAKERAKWFVKLDREEWKYDVLCDLYKQLTINQALIYCNKRQKAEWLAEKMSAEGFPLSFIHGEMEPEERQKRMKDFRSGTVRVMISTDLLARGIDIQQISLVINYELPTQRENYIHRIGRSGRFGRKGAAINLVTLDEERLLKELEQHYSTTINVLPEDLAKIIL
jgi:superfamily II DNA/RNA helicase